MSAGIFTSSNFTQSLVKPSFASLITRLMPNGAAPLFGMTSMLKTDTAVQFEHGFFTKTMLFPQLTMGASALSTDTTLTVTSTSNIIPGMIFRVDSTSAGAPSTGEMLIVNNVLSGTQVQVTRGIGSAIVAAAIPNGALLYQVGSAFEEASLRPNSLIINPVRVTNFTQIFRNTWAISDSVRATLMIAGDTNVAESKQDCTMFHAADIEKGIFFGQKSASGLIRNGQPFRTMDGLVSIVNNASYYPPIYQGTPNTFTAGATTNYTQLEGFLDPVFNQATDPRVANERVLFVGGASKRVLNNIGRLNGTYQLVSGQNDWGLQFDTFKTSRGTFRVIEHPLFNSNANWSKMAVAVDLSSFTLAYLGDRKTQYKAFNEDSDANDNGIDAVGGTLTTELTTVIKNPPANSVIYNLQAAAQG